MAAALYIFTPNHKAEIDDTCQTRQALKVTVLFNQLSKTHRFKKKLCDPTIILFVLNANCKRNTGIGDG